MAIYEFPASFGQRRMWLLDQIDPARPTYNIGWALWLDGPLDVDILRRVWESALDRHEALRTTFRNEAGTPTQVIDDESRPRRLEVVSLEHLPAVERDAVAREELRNRARESFDLGTAPLVRATLLRLSESEHVLGVVAHHIAADGWSFRVLFDEISSDYEAILASAEPVSSEPPIQYADFALWQIEHAGDGGYATAERFWRTELADAPPSIALPTDHPYPERPNFTAGGVDLVIDETLATGLRRVAAERGTGFFAVLLASYAALLSRISGDDDLLIAVPMAARTRPETESLVGLCMNTVTTRVRVQGDPTLGRLVEQSHATIAEVLAHQDLPFARVVELVRPERDPARMPLVQVMFALEEPWSVPDRGGLRWRPELVENGTAKFELELTVTDLPSGPRVRLNYHSDLFDAESARGFVDGFRAMLVALVNDPDLRVSDVDILAPDMRERLTREWAVTRDRPAYEPTTMTRLLEEACVGDHVTVVDKDRVLTGDDVATQARRIAAGLRDLGIGVGDRVGILLPRGARLIPALFGVWWAGASYVPLDPIYPARRLRSMQADAGIRAMILDTAEEPTDGIDPTLPVLDIAVADAEPHGDLPDIVDVPPNEVAFTIFTSGSTGRPKAVAVTHDSVAALSRTLRDRLDLGRDDRFVSVATFAFDIAVLEMLLPILCGGSVRVAEPEEASDGALLRELLATCGATALQGTPATWRLLTDAGGVPDNIRLRITGGDAMPRALADTLLESPGAELWNLYGPTETTIYSAGARTEPSPALMEIGSMVAGTTMYVLDRWMRPVPPGVIGEIYHGGGAVTRGYVGAPAMTAERFLPDPYGDAPGGRLYRTGDLGRWRRWGRVEVVGRADRQVKIRGFRVETGEIEAVLRTHPEISQAVVVAKYAPDVRLVAYLVTGTDEPPADVRTHLREFVPDYMIPAAFVVLDRFPFTSSGKVDHRALPEPRWGVLPGEEKVAPRTPLESELAVILADLLTLPEPVGVLDNFFALGGHSLTATRLMAHLWSTYGVDLPVRVFFADPTVEGLATAIMTAYDAGADDGAGGRLPDPHGGPGSAASGILDSLTDGDVDGILRTLITDERG